MKKVKKSINSQKLRNFIDGKGIKYGYLSNQLGVKTQTLQRKIDGFSDFGISQIQKLIELLGLTWEKDKDLIREIFLPRM